MSLLSKNVLFYICLLSCFLQILDYVCLVRDLVFKLLDLTLINHFQALQLLVQHVVLSVEHLVLVTLIIALHLQAIYLQTLFVCLVSEPLAVVFILFKCFVLPLKRFEFKAHVLDFSELVFRLSSFAFDSDTEFHCSRPVASAVAYQDPSTTLSWLSNFRPEIAWSHRSRTRC